jgi:mycothiol synthase
MQTRIRCYEPGDEEKIVQLWNRVLAKDPVSVDVFERKILLDPNFDSSGALLAFDDEDLTGYVQCLVRKYPNFYDGLEEDKGWISVFVATSDSVGATLLERADEFFRERGRKEVWFSSYTPNYFWPGIDSECYPELYRMLRAKGYSDVYQALAMDAELWPSFTYPSDIEQSESRLGKEGIRVCELTTKELVELLRFLRENFSADWYRHCIELLSRGASKEQVVVALRNEREVVGYCQFWGNEGFEWSAAGEHFGPFGVKEELRGKGIGSVVLYRCLKNMKKMGIHRAFFLWTDPKAAKLYQRFGFRTTRKFTVMKKVM